MTLFAMPQELATKCWCFLRGVWVAHNAGEATPRLLKVSIVMTRHSDAGLGKEKPLVDKLPGPAYPHTDRRGLGSTSP
jgi:hypothetical protein